jgi:hypothetical protein
MSKVRFVEFAIFYSSDFRLINNNIILEISRLLFWFILSLFIIIILQRESTPWELWLGFLGIIIRILFWSSLISPKPDGADLPIVVRQSPF